MCSNHSATFGTRTVYPEVKWDADKYTADFARKNHPDIEFIHADATDFRISGTVDIVFSNAVLHWIGKEHQQDMLSCVYQALKENGQFVFETKLTTALSLVIMLDADSHL